MFLENGESRLPVLLKHAEAWDELYLKGAIGIGCARELQACLLTALSVAKPLRIHLESVTALDLSALQLLFVALREWTQTGIAIELVGPVRAQVAASIRDAGFPGTLATAESGVLSEV